MANQSILDKCKMTPQEIFEYKNRWKPEGYAVQIHSDLDVQCKGWCRGNLNRWEWSMDTYTDVYAHTFVFESENHSKTFAKRFEKWIVDGKQ